MYFKPGLKSVDPETTWGTKGLAFWNIEPPFPYLNIIEAGYPPIIQVLSYITLP